MHILQAQIHHDFLDELDASTFGPSPAISVSSAAFVVEAAPSWAPRWSVPSSPVSSASTPVGGVGGATSVNYFFFREDVDARIKYRMVGKAAGGGPLDTEAVPARPA